LHEAHATVAGGGKLGVIAVVRYFCFGDLAGFDHTSAFGDLYPMTVDLHVDETLFGGEVFGQFFVGSLGSVRGLIAHNR